ncbi:FAD-binding oxidoreductase [Ligilactobacillus pobuzihii]|uniref:Lactate dehydrogenase (Oxidoreductase) n=1 Tax=Ligilactobacillus pobuzihii TaxID=449659 RepID=A0A0R2LK76_9LACO|nr:FAD-linked oxidase C-terminal domain-containing protein [Ligilactobacillus pobuzihii]KRK09362.1 lactate dehydrogenase (oxidoreductase) [Ligilactobacillus pobuzihii E100301 = KCTC 13174]KRN98532.1 lactate dehydrogenase (oxidoreductase) [Ligilactobacillus pobuzihii]GEN48559.1 FAD-binding protein [Ligilactobacillus pobuzihii]
MAIFSAYTNDEVIDFLKQNAPHAQIHLDDDLADKHAANGNAQKKIVGHILAYIEVGDVEDIRGVVKTATTFHLPIVPQGADTSTVIGADGINDALIISTARMNHIKEVSKADSLAVVEPGVINQDLDKAARKQGMFYAPDPASKPMSSIGGNVSTNAGGMSGVKYGATKDAVLGMKVMLENGEEISLGGRTFKQAFGYDLTQLFVGSEGTFGIITEITVKLVPQPVGKSITGVAFFEDMSALAKGVADLRNSGLNPAMLEAMDGKTVKALDEYEKTSYSKSESSSLLIFSFDGASDLQENESQKILEKHHAWGVQVTSDPDEMTSLVKLRQDMLPAVFAKGKYYVMEDMAVPLSKLADMADYITQVGSDLGVEIYTAGHAGDGNLHPTLLWNDKEDAPENVLKAIRLLFRHALELGGTISGEHAVGMSKNQWNNVELGSAVDRIQHQLKNLFDPMNIMNPKRKIN